MNINIRNSPKSPWQSPCFPGWWFQPLWKYSSMGRIIPYIMENKSNVWNHQPVYHVDMFWWYGIWLNDISCNHIYMIWVWTVNQHANIPSLSHYIPLSYVIIPCYQWLTLIIPLIIIILECSPHFGHFPPVRRSLQRHSLGTHGIGSSFRLVEHLAVGLQW
jgi:hypothetical protein